MGGIYFHIPFCRRKCVYCNFFSVADLRSRARMVEAMAAELSFRAPGWKDRQLLSVYFGGGTPSLLPTRDIAFLLERTARCLSLSPQAEITLEANPEDITEEKAREWRSAGINRLSVGVQSFDDAALAFMGRRHSGSEAVRAVEILSQAGFSRISLDLIYGVPGRSDAALGREIETAVGLGVEHISAYALTREAGTAWDVGIARGRMPAADDEMASRQYFQVVDALERAGYSRYEVSNFARPGARSRHNSAYWSGAPYLGIGPSAHSFDGDRIRRWNVASVGRYLAGGTGGDVPFEEEVLSLRDRRNETVMTALRTGEGLPLDPFARQFGAKSFRRLMGDARPFLEAGQLEVVDGALRITRAGWFFTDGISAGLFEVD